MENKSLWGKIEDIETIKTPALVLKEQAGILTKATRGLLRGRLIRFASGRGTFEFGLDIVAPTMGDYSYEILRISYPLVLYPVNVRDIVHEKAQECNNEEEYLLTIESILSSLEVRNVIKMLLSQAKST